MAPPDKDVNVTDAELTAQTKQLQINAAKCDGSLAQGNKERIKRQRDALQKLAVDIDDRRREIELEKLQNQEDPATIAKWSDSVEAEIEKADNQIDRLSSWLQSAEREEQAKQRDEQLQFEKCQQEQLLYFASQKAKLQPEAEKQPSLQTSDCDKAKLPKIEIAKFEGQTSDWLRFWSQFEESVDKRNMASINKLGYLQGSLSPKIRSLISGLPYTEEVYNEAKKILN